MKLFIALLAVLVPDLVLAQAYNINWHKIAGGGGISAGANYQASASIGQRDAGRPMTGATYSITGGFWSLLSAVQTPGAPILTITNAGASIIVSWPAAAGAFTLQTNSNLGPTGWGPFGGAVETSGKAVSATLTPPSGRLFFRLKSAND